MSVTLNIILSSAVTSFSLKSVNICRTMRCNCLEEGNIEIEIGFFSKLQEYGTPEMTRNS
jgi:hypothetical protein